MMYFFWCENYRHPEVASSEDGAMNWIGMGCWRRKKNRARLSRVLGVFRWENIWENHGTSNFYGKIYREIMENPI
jgi:hypothetical protein